MQRASSGSMPLVASDSRDEAFGSPSRFRDGVDRRLWRFWSPAGCGVRGPTPRADCSMRGPRPSSRYRQPAAAGLSGDDRALTAPVAAKASTCARNRVNSSRNAAAYGGLVFDIAGTSSSQQDWVSTKLGQLQYNAVGVRKIDGAGFAKR